MEYPTPETVDDWDDASLLSVVGLEATERQQRHGIESLNDSERVLCCLGDFEGDVNNGGFGMWLADRRPSVLLATVAALDTIGATDMASFVRSVLAKLGDIGKFATLDDWQAHFESLPDEYHEGLETLSGRYVELEAAYLALAYRYARGHWHQVRTG